MCSPYRWVTVGRDPHASKVIGIDFVLYKLSPSLLVDVDASRLAMMDLTAYHCGVGVGLHLKSCYTVSMDVTVLKVTLKHREEDMLDDLWCIFKQNIYSVVWLVCIYHAVIEGEHADVASVVDVVTSNDGITVVLHPNSC